MSADEVLVRAHLNGAAFRSGADRSRWGFPNGDPNLQWPHCVLWVQADARFCSSERVVLRFTLDGYPAQAPTAVPWDCEKLIPLLNEKWPKGPGNVSKVFNPTGWRNTALYAPCDRIAMVGHEPWKISQSHWWWNADKDITHYLEFVHRCLNPRDYET